MTTARLTAALFAGSLAFSAQAETFDTPAATEVVSLPADPANPQAKPKRTCTYYGAFVVKEVDLGEKGAFELSIAAISGAAPKCDGAIAGEVEIDPARWSGYFRGAKGGFLFFDADDGWNGGIPFALFDTEARKLFDDSKEGETFDALGIVDGTLVARYRRVWTAPCSMMADAAGCWATIAAATSLADGAKPDCTAAYKEEMERTPKFASDIPAVPSVIAYDVELRGSAGSWTITPLSAPAKCRLAE